MGTLQGYGRGAAGDMQGHGRQQQQQQHQQQQPGMLDHLSGIDFNQTLVSSAWRFLTTASVCTAGMCFEATG